MENQPLTHFLPLVIFHVLLWSGLATILWKLPTFNQYKKKFLIINHMVSTAYCIYFCSKTLSFHSMMPTNYPKGSIPTRFEEQEMFAIALGYTLYDAIALWFIEPCVVKNKQNRSNSGFLVHFHHVVGLSAYLYSIVQSNDAFYMLQGILLQEISSISYGIYRVMQHMKCGPSLFDICNKIAFFSTFTLVRVVLGLHLEFYILTNGISTFCAIFGFLAGVYSIVWFGEICAWVAKQIKKYMSS
eukprot:243048_1